MKAVNQYKYDKGLWNYGDYYGKTGQLIRKITVHHDGFAVAFKSGVSVEIAE